MRPQSSPNVPPNGNRRRSGASVGGVKVKNDGRLRLLLASRRGPDSVEDGLRDPRVASFDSVEQNPHQATATRDPTLVAETRVPIDESRELLRSASLLESFHATRLGARESDCCRSRPGTGTVGRLTSGRPASAGSAGVAMVSCPRCERIGDAWSFPTRPRTYASAGTQSQGLSGRAFPSRAKPAYWRRIGWHEPPGLVLLPDARARSYRSHPTRARARVPVDAAPLRFLSAPR